MINKIFFIAAIDPVENKWKWLQSYGILLMDTMTWWRSEVQKNFQNNE